MLVDSHTHVSRTWFEPVEMLLHQMAQHAVAHAVLIQDNVQFDNRYQFECVRRYPGKFANVVMVDMASHDASATLEDLAARGATGVRFFAVGRSPGRDPLAIWRTAERLRLGVSCSGRMPYYASREFAELVEAVPSLNIAIEHLGLRGYAHDSPPEPAILEQYLSLARYPNVYVKVPALGQYAKRILPPLVEGFPFERPIPPYLELVYAAFGADHLMWGSNYPPVSYYEGYGNALRGVQSVLADKNEAERNLIFGETALRVFPLSR
jgi:L-fuconolactonase